MHSQITPPKIDLTKSSPLKENSSNLNKDKPKKNVLNKETCDKNNDVEDLELEEDELPNLSKGVASVLQSKANKMRNEEKCNMEISENSVVVNSDKNDKAKKVPEQDSGYLTTPGVSSEEENSSEPPNNGIVDSENNTGLEQSASESKRSNTDEKAHSETDNSDDSGNVALRLDDEESKTNETESQSKTLSKAKPSSAMKALHTGLSQGLSSLGVAEVTPTLSGGPDWMIDLDDDHPPTKKPSGVTKLMERLMKHSTKRHTKKGQDVELRYKKLIVSSALPWITNHNYRYISKSFKYLFKCCGHQMHLYCVSVLY